MAETLPPDAAASQPDAQSEIYDTGKVAATVGTAAYGYGLLGKAMDGQSQSGANVATDTTRQLAAHVAFQASMDGTQPLNAQGAPDSRAEQAAVNAAEGQTASGAETPAARTFRQWKEMVSELTQAEEVAAPYLNEKMRQEWRDALKSSQDFAQQAQNFSDPHKVEQGFLAEPGKTSYEVAQNRFGTITEAVKRLKENPASAATFFDRQKPRYGQLDWQSGPEFKPAEWLAAITLNKTGTDLDLEAKRALQDPDAFLALQALPQGQTMQDAVRKLAQAVQTGTKKLEEAGGGDYALAVPIGELNDGKTPERRAEDNLMGEIVKGLKLTEHPSPHTPQSLEQAAAFVAALPVEDLPIFIRTCHAKDSEDFPSWNPDSRLDQPHHFATLLPLAHAEAWGKKKEEIAKTQTELGHQFIALSARAGKAMQAILTDVPEAQQAFHHGITLEQLPEKTVTRLTHYLRKPNANGVMPEVEKKTITHLTTLVESWEKLAKETPEARRHWAEEHGFGIMQAAKPLLDALEDAVANERGEFDLKAGTLFHDRLDQWLRKHSELDHHYDANLSEATFRAFGKTNGERAAKLHFLENLKPHEAHAVLEAIGVQAKDRPLSDKGADISDRAGALAGFATPEGLAKLHVPTPPHEGHGKEGHKPPHAEHPEGPIRPAPGGYPEASAEAAGSHAEVRAVSEPPQAAQTTPNPDHPAPSTPAQAAGLSSASSEAPGKPPTGADSHVERLGIKSGEQAGTFTEMIGQKTGMPIQPLPNAMNRVEASKSQTMTVGGP